MNSRRCKVLRKTKHNVCDLGVIYAIHVRYVPEPWEGLRSVCGPVEPAGDKIPLPTLHLIGSDDRLVSPAESSRAARLFHMPQ
eukprot:scaffold184748_cov16-Prasinocladus_malaysianus.AAC.1